MPDGLRNSLNYLAGTTDLDAQGAANAWAFTDDIELLGVLNIKNNSVGLGLNEVLRELAVMWGGDPTKEGWSALNTAIRFTLFPDEILYPEVDLSPGVE